MRIPLVWITDKRNSTVYLFVSVLYMHQMTRKCRKIRYFDYTAVLIIHLSRVREYNEQTVQPLLPEGRVTREQVRLLRT